MFETVNPSFGPVARVAEFAAAVLKATLQKIVVKVNTNEGEYLSQPDLWSCVPYKFTSVFEWMSWRLFYCSQGSLFEPMRDIDEKLREAAMSVVCEVSDEAVGLLKVWYMGENWRRENWDWDCDYDLCSFLIGQLHEKMKKSGEEVKAKIDEFEEKIEEEKREKRIKFKYSDEDYQLLTALKAIHDRTDNEVIGKAIDFCEAFLEKDIPEHLDQVHFTIIYRNENSGCRYMSFSLEEDRLHVALYGKVMSPDSEIEDWEGECWDLDEFEHATGLLDIESEALALLDLGAQIEED